jgi:hypothetical protein
MVLGPTQPPVCGYCGTLFAGVKKLWCEVDLFRDHFMAVKYTKIF